VSSSVFRGSSTALDALRRQTGWEYEFVDATSGRLLAQTADLRFGSV